MVVRTFLWLSLVSAAHGFLAPAPRALKPLSTRRGEALYASKAKQGLFSPAVEATKAIMGEQELLEFRAKVILEHSKVIGKFVDTHDSKFGQIALKTLFDAADKNDDGTLDVDEVRGALNALGFTWLDEDKSGQLVGRADVNGDEVIDFEEFAKAAPKVLRTNLVKLAKQNGNDLGFLV